MVDNIQAFNLRLAKEKRRIGNAKGTLLTKAEVTKQAVINLRLRDPRRLWEARQAVRQSIINAGMKLSSVKSRDVDVAVKQIIREGFPKL